MDPWSTGQRLSLSLSLSLSLVLLGVLTLLLDVVLRIVPFISPSRQDDSPSLFPLNLRIE